uniref:Uncharacterized protein n=1 Tax=Cacopsylla melanoneura TaxID=428564 RepID=A0A8D8SC10_9HEMI
MYYCFLILCSKGNLVQDKYYRIFLEQLTNIVRFVVSPPSQSSLVVLARVMDLSKQLEDHDMLPGSEGTLNKFVDQGDSKDSLDEELFSIADRRSSTKCGRGLRM